MPNYIDKFQTFRNAIRLSFQFKRHSFYSHKGHYEMQIKSAISHIAGHFRRMNLTLVTSKEIKSTKNRKTFASLAALGLFSWDDYRITNNEVEKEIHEILGTLNTNNKNDDQEQNLNKHRIDFEAARLFEDKEWSKIYDKKDLIIWRRTIGYDEENRLDLYEHKVLGRFDDITPIEYFQTQIDLEYRKEWDFLVKLLECIKKDYLSRSEVIRWITKFPYPLNDREYVFIRRYCIEPNEKLLIMLSRGIPEMSDLVYNKSAVKVTQYKSNMIIIPYEDFDKNGIYYIIQYYDVNKAKIPKLAYSFITSSGLPDYVSKLRKASLKLRQKNNSNCETDFLEEFKDFQIYTKIKTPETEMNPKLESDEENIENSIIKNETQESQPEYEDKKDDSNQNQLNAQIPQVVVFLVQKLNEDYFDSEEPHPIFFNF